MTRAPIRFSARPARARMRALVAAALLTAFAGSAAFAQAGAANCGSAQLQPREHPDPQLEQKGGADLSERLAQSGGVICPPQAVDPAIKAPTPNTGDTPVIRPPEHVQPK